MSAFLFEQTRALCWRQRQQSFFSLVFLFFRSPPAVLPRFLFLFSKLPNFHLSSGKMNFLSFFEGVSVVFFGGGGFFFPGVGGVAFWVLSFGVFLVGALSFFFWGCGGVGGGLLGVGFFFFFFFFFFVVFFGFFFSCYGDSFPLLRSRGGRDSFFYFLGSFNSPSIRIF